VLKTWQKAFPGTVKPRSAISEDLMAHLRYPEDLFKVQRDLLTRYHVTDPQAFYNRESFWKIPEDPTVSTVRADQPPYYLTLKMPDQEQPGFSLTSVFVPNNRDNLAAFMAVNSAPGPDYGRLRVLQLPSGTAIKGPRQIQNDFASNPDVANLLNILQRGDSKVEYGNLLTLPVGGGLLYVEPVYVKGTGGANYPRLQKVLVAFGDRIAFEDTLQQALDKVFQGNAGVPTGELPGAVPSPGTAPGNLPGVTPEVRKALEDARKALADSQQALRKNPPDFAAYGEAQKRLQEALNRALGLPPGQSFPVSPTPSPLASSP
jgi:uncharacterized protein